MPALASPEGVQTQQDLLSGRKTPLLALAAPAAGAPRGERPEAGAKSALVPVGQAAKLLVADRTAGRGSVGLGDSLALQFQTLALYLDFQMTEVLILGDHKRFGILGQVHRQFCCYYRQRSRTMRTSTLTDMGRQANLIHAVILPATTPFVRSKTEMRRNYHGIGFYCGSDILHNVESAVLFKQECVPSLLG